MGIEHIIERTGKNSYGAVKEIEEACTGYVGVSSAEGHREYIIETQEPVNPSTPYRSVKEVV